MVTSGRISVDSHLSVRPMAALVGTMAAVLLLITAVPPESGAYVLEGSHVLYLTAKAMGRFSSLEVTQQLTVYPPTRESEPFTFDETAIYVMPERFRSDIVSDQIQRTHLEFGNSFLTVVDGRTVEEKNPYDMYQRLLRSRTHSQLMRTVNQLGVETAISSLGRVEETIVYVLGARYPDESVSQLAVDKETFLPLRLLLVDSNPESGQPPMEIFYRDWRKSNKGWFPFHVVTMVDGQPDREIRVTQLRVNPSIPSTKMDLEALQASIAASKMDTPQEQKQETVEEIQQGVKDFQKKFE